MSDARRLKFLTIAVVVVLAVVALAPIRSYDLFWHLATGRWMVDHHALPASDPFALASDRTPWVNGEWLFELVLHGTESVAGLQGLWILRALLAGGVYGLAFWFAAREAEPPTALLMTAIAFAGAMPTFDLRPSAVAALLVVLALGSRSTLMHAILAVIWINTHPSALIAPFIALLVTRRVAPPLASAVALLLNPHGLHGIIAPLKLLLFVGSGTFHNIEWSASAPTLFPILYIAVVVAVGAFATSERPREQWWRVLLLGGFAFLAIRHVRDQGLFFAAFPPLVTPALRSMRSSRAMVFGAAALVIGLVAVRTDHRGPLLPGRFPTQAVSRLAQTGLRGNIYNPDQFGGYLIWSFYPQRRVLTDGRNELYHSFIPEYAVARENQRAWRRLLEKYRIDVAVDEYRPPLHVVEAGSGRSADVPASLAYWPRREWALIAFDDAGMVFARRAAFDERQLARWEIRGVVPDTVRAR